MKAKETSTISKKMEVACPCGNIVKVPVYVKTIKCPKCLRVGDVSWTWKPVSSSCGSQGSAPGLSAGEQPADKQGQSCVQGATPPIPPSAPCTQTKGDSA